MIDEVRIRGRFYPQKPAIELKVDDVVLHSPRGTPIIIVDVVKWDDTDIVFQVADIYADGGIGNNLHEEIFRKDKMVAYSYDMRGN